jgi:hypothetical protein
MKYPIIGICYTTWCGLGFIRGINYYKYKYYKYKYYKYEQKDPYMYLSLILNGLFGSIIYGNPCFLPITIYKEIYRFEINMRNIENEKKTDFYNELF